MPFNDNGYQAETLDEIITDINNIFINVFGDKVNLNVSSPNGQFINQLAQMAQQNQNFMVTLTSGLYNPDIATTAWLDSLCALCGIQRLQATFSSVTCTCYGSSGVVIPTGTIIQSTNGDNFSLLNQITIGSGGTIDGTFIAINSGPIPVTVGSVNKIINQVYGWDSVNNQEDGIIGNSLQTDASLRASRTALLNNYGSASIGSIYSNLVQGLSLPNNYVLVFENNSATPISKAGITMVAHSIAVIVVTTTDKYPTVAQIIFNKKCPGVNQNGNTTYTYTDHISGSEFVAEFIIPIPTALQVNISYPIGTYPSDFTANIQQAIVNNFNGEDISLPNLSSVGLYELINVSRFTPSLLNVPSGSNYQDLTIELKVSGTPAPSIQLDAYLIPTLAIDDVIVSFV